FGTTIKESFEMIKEYCIKTGQEEIWKNQPFYHYARIIRNVMSHNFLFDFSKENKNKFPVKWKSKKIELSMQGLLLFDFFGPIDVFDLLSTFNYFVKNTLN
ncbi:MAG: hypothetical protein H8E17_16460, partial [Deltaproteobacteria bacterium]|nr:hypothetical protein [Deltaproteobacteria bacterium]